MRFEAMLKQTMLDACVSVANIADYSYRSVSTVRRWLNGTQTPNKIILQQLGTYLKNDRSYFLQNGIVYPNGKSRM